MELYRKLRPKTPDELVGQLGAAARLKKMIATNDIPHAVMMYGPSGCGKTTAGRILARHLGATETNAGLMEVNCAIIEPMQTVRKIEEEYRYRGIMGTNRVYILDETQSLSRAQGTQQALLKMLEDPPSHSYFILCTTDPGKIIPTIRNRCERIQFLPIGNDDLHGLLARTAKVLNWKSDQALRDAIVGAAENSARRLMVLIQQIQGLSIKEALACVSRIGPDDDADAMELIKCILPFDGNTADWPRTAKTLEKLGDWDAEGLRHLILKCARSSLLKGGRNAKQAFRVINIFRDQLFDSNSAAAILAANCFEAVSRPS